MAYLKGERLDATEIPHDPWRALPKQPGYEDLVLLECGKKARRVTRLGRQFFAHWPKIYCQIDHKSESSQHLAMKVALKDRINACPGWSAEVEYVGPGRQWIADVMAVHDTGRRLAFEVQLSPQTEEDYFDRSQRYADAGIGPVWVVPQQVSWRDLKLPVIVTGFGKSSELPEAPSDLMSRQEYQPLYLKAMCVGLCVDNVLHPSFRWEPGSPNQQRQRLLKEAEAARQRAAAAVAAEIACSDEEARKAAAQWKVKQQQELVAAEEAARFVRLAMPAQAITSGLPIVAGAPIWGSVVICPKSNHSVLIWRLSDPVSTDPKESRWLSERENFRNVHRHVESWLEAANEPVLKGKLVPVKSSGNPLGFTCTDCNHLIQGRLVRMLAPDKWSIIAGAEGPAIRYVSSEQALQGWESLRARPQPKRQARREQKPRRQMTGAAPVAQHSDVIGPQGKPFWMTEARSAEEIAERQAAKDARAAQLQAVRDNPRYHLQPNGFRFNCLDCGNVFEDGYEGIHAESRCVAGRR
ncbi:competence protein CoiA [Arthrobacter pityocampae]|uniref:competence protein CoiA n=1 Tax=Arthrobacter pityocampae TaxID=547334 RepID=UPI00373637DE